jgi:hypothetical protein
VRQNNSITILNFQKIIRNTIKIFAHLDVFEKIIASPGFGISIVPLKSNNA